LRRRPWCSSSTPRHEGERLQAERLRPEKRDDNIKPFTGSAEKMRMRPAAGARYRIPQKLPKPPVRGQKITCNFSGSR
jgi:hypothetical protein